MKKLLLIVLVLISVGSSVVAQPKVSVDITKEHQTIAGFGAFGAEKAYWDSPPFYTDNFINLFLNDLGSTIVRTNIFWDFEPVNDNGSPSTTDLTKFNYKTGSDLAKQIPYYKALKAAGLKRLIATSWTPPVWMKLFDDPDRIPDQCYNCNNCPIGDPARKVCGGRLDPKYYNEYAEYLATYVKVIKQETGIDIYAISLQNEPFFANPFEANVVMPTEYADILKAVGERFRQDGLTTKLFGPEHMAEWSWGWQQQYVAETLGDADARKLLDIYAVHGYVDGVAPDFGSAEGWTALKDNIVTQYDKPLWMTETSGYPVTADGAMDLAKSMYLAFRFGEISAWVFWSINGSDDGYSLMVNSAPSPTYYASKQYFKFIRPGAIRVDATSEDSDILPLAFKNPTTGAMTLLLINSGATDQQIQLDAAVKPDQFTLYRTSATENCVEIGTISTNTLTLPAKSISTLVGFGDSGPSIDEVANRFLKVGAASAIEIPLTGISNGNGGTLNITAEASDPNVVSSLEVVYTSPQSTGTLRFNLNTATAAKAKITLHLENQNTTSPTEFAFNSTQTSFDVEVVNPANVVTGVKKNENRIGLRIYPNPSTSGNVEIELDPSSSERKLTVFDLYGKEITVTPVKAGVHHLSLQTNQWKSGLYYIQVAGARAESRAPEILTGKVITVK